MYIHEILYFMVVFGPSKIVRFYSDHHVSLPPLLADCELTWLRFLHSSRSRTSWFKELQFWVFDQSSMLSLHLLFGFPLPLLPWTIPSKHSLDRPTDERLICPKSLRVLLLILWKRGGSDVLLWRVEILVFSVSRCPVMKRMTWFWNTSMRLESCLVHVMQSKPYKTTGRT